MNALPGGIDTMPLGGNYGMFSLFMAMLWLT